MHLKLEKNLNLKKKYGEFVLQKNWIHIGCQFELTQLKLNHFLSNNNHPRSSSDYAIYHFHKDTLDIHREDIEACFSVLSKLDVAPTFFN